MFMLVSFWTILNPGGMVNIHTISSSAMIIVNRLKQTKAARSWVISYSTDTISPKQMQAR